MEKGGSYHGVVSHENMAIRVDQLMLGAVQMEHGKLYWCYGWEKRF